MNSGCGPHEQEVGGEVVEFVGDAVEVSRAGLLFDSVSCPDALSPTISAMSRFKTLFYIFLQAQFVGDLVGDVFEIAFDALKWAVNLAIDVFQAVQPFLKYLNFITPFIPFLAPLNFFNFLEFGMPLFSNLPFFGNSLLNDVIFFINDLIPVFPSGAGQVQGQR